MTKSRCSGGSDTETTSAKRAGRGGSGGTETTSGGSGGTETTSGGLAKAAWFSSAKRRTISGGLHLGRLGGSGRSCGRGGCLTKSRSCGGSDTETTSAKRAGRGDSGGSETTSGRSCGRGGSFILTKGRFCGGTKGGDPT